MDYLFTLFEGIASFISPCMLPLLPIYLSYFAGKDNKSTKKTMINSIGFVLGFTITFIILAILASSIGVIISSYIKYIKIIFGIIIIVLGLNYMNILKINFLNKTKDFKKKSKDVNFFKTLLFGILFSVSYTPCIGTFLSSALLLVVKQQDILKGILLMLVYSLGLGLPFIISAVIIDKLKGMFEFIKKHYNVIEKVSGIVLIIMGIYIIFF